TLRRGDGPPTARRERNGESDDEREEVRTPVRPPGAASDPRHRAGGDRLGVRASPASARAPPATARAGAVRLPARGRMDGRAGGGDRDGQRRRERPAPLHPDGGGRGRLAGPAGPLCLLSRRADGEGGGRGGGVRARDTGGGGGRGARALRARGAR